MEEYQLRKDIDRFKNFLDLLEIKLQERGIYDLDLNKMFDMYYDKSEINGLLNGSIDIGDLSDYVRKDEVGFEVLLQDNGTMVFDLSVGE